MSSSNRWAPPSQTGRGSESQLADVHLLERRPPPARHREPAPLRKLTMQKGRFEGDVAVKDLRERMARAPDLPPEPLMRDDGGSAFGMVGRLIILVSMAAIAAYGFAWASKPRDLERGFALAAYGKPPAGEEPGAARDDGGLQSVPVQAARDETPPADRPELLAPVRRLDPNQDDGLLRHSNLNRGDVDEFHAEPHTIRVLRRPVRPQALGRRRSSPDQPGK